MLPFKEVEFSALAADYYHLTNGQRLRVSNTIDERKPKQKVRLTFLERFSSIDVGMTKKRTMILPQNSIAVAIVHVDIQS